MSEPVVDRCPNCGAPLSLDAEGRCQWCQAHVRSSPSGAGRLSAEDAELLADLLQPERVNPLAHESDDVMLLLPAMVILSSVCLLGMDPAVKTWVDSSQLGPPLKQLLDSMRAGAKRVQLLAMADRHYDEFADHSRMYTAEEWWVLKLGIDLQIFLAGLPGIGQLEGARHAADGRRLLDEHSHHIHKALKDAGAGPEPLRSLRAAIPG